MKMWQTLMMIGGMLLSGMIWAEEGASLHPKLEAFRPLLGQTWAGEFPPAKDGSAVTDVVRYERALNGMAVRSLHSINDGVYGGETLFRYDEAAGKVVFHYFTTQGFVTKGEIEQEADGSFRSIEMVENPAAAGGVTRVEAVFRVSADRLEVESTYFKGEESAPGHSAVYVPAPERAVVFR